MILIDNPVDFLALLRGIAKEIYNILTQRMTSNAKIKLAALFCPTDITTTNDLSSAKLPIVKSFCFLPNMTNIDTESEDLSVEALSYLDLCKFSLDNKEYLSLETLLMQNRKKLRTVETSSKTLKDLFKSYIDLNNCESFYVCDITKTYYCHIDTESLIYFYRSFFQGIEYKKDSFYWNLFPYELFYFCKNNKQLLLDPSQLENFTLCDIYADKIDDNKCYPLITLDADDINPKNVFKNFTIEDDRTIKKNINRYKAKYTMSLNICKVKKLNVFGQDIPFEFLKEKKNETQLRVPIIFAVNNMFSESEYPNIGMSDFLQENYDLIVKEYTEDEINLEEIGQNSLKLIRNYSNGLRFYIIPLLKLVHKVNKQTMLICDFISMLESSKFLEFTDIFDIDDSGEAFAEFFSINYTNHYFQIMYETQQKLESYHNDVDNFQGGFVGGGYGILGALKGAVKASIANAVIETGYKIYKASQLNPELIVEMSKEFLLTEESKQYVRELLILDIKLLCYKYIDAMYLFAADSDDILEYFGIGFAKGMYQSFKKSAQLYSIALAKHLNLTVMPNYTEIQNMSYYIDADPLKTIEQAILEFPCDRDYYLKYFELGGEITENLKIYATLHMVDIDDIYMQEKERIQKEMAKQAEIEKARAENERQEEIRKQKAFERINGLNGNVINRYPDLFTCYINNPIYSEYSGQIFHNHQEITQAVFSYINHYHNNVNTYFYPVYSKEFSTKQDNLIKVYGADKIQESTVLFFFDNTVFGSAKDGFVLTNESFCYRNLLSTPSIIPINEIHSITMKGCNLYVNDMNIEVTMCKLQCSEIVNVLNFCICNLLLLFE